MLWALSLTSKLAMILSVVMHVSTGLALGFVPFQLRKRYQPFWWVVLLVLGLFLIAWAGWPEMWTAVGWRSQSPLEMAEAISHQRLYQGGNYFRGGIFIAAALFPYAYLGAIKEAE